MLYLTLDELRLIVKNINADNCESMSENKFIKFIN